MFVQINRNHPQISAFMQVYKEGVKLYVCLKIFDIENYTDQVTSEYREEGVSKRDIFLAFDRPSRQINLQQENESADNFNPLYRTITNNSIDVHHVI